ncbi:sensor histidine kinase [Roseateles amylovorans]|uniref:histidine kinase n=1 Tax=Roseateles amylovorans TaxID=2978473 RepID=A0ABY6B7X8_9BURK|nr:HAMP domain-containing histidine kinase [Roseateles amylovorans]UXH80944.1 HAMP domain-containing histidine kinase [Roseateles amylovorans]
MFVAGMALSVGIVSVAVLMLAQSFSQRLLHSGIEDYTEAIAEHLRFDAHGVPVGVDESKIEPWLFSSLAEELSMRILDGAGRVIHSSEPMAQSLALAPEGEAFDPERRSFAFHRNGIAMHGATVRFTHAGRPWMFQFATSDRLVLRMRDSIGLPAVGRGIAATCGVFLIIFFVTIHLTLKRALQPLRDASADAQRITPRTLDERIQVEAQPAEIRPLVTAFNQALDRLQNGFRTQQEFLASAAHELKTPLALIRAQVELGPQDAHRRLLLDDVDRMARQVQQLLMLAEVSEPQNYRIETLDPRATLQEVFDYMSRVGERREVHLGLRIDDDLRHWRADRGALFTLLKNLLENAIQHSPPGSVVSLTVGRLGFSVVDQGPGVTADQLPRLFERFWRGPDRREEGAGLGLSICTEIATAHGWRLTPHCAAPGQGLTMRAEMPGSAALKLEQGSRGKAGSRPPEPAPRGAAARPREGAASLRQSAGRAVSEALF